MPYYKPSPNTAGMPHYTTHGNQGRRKVSNRDVLAIRDYYHVECVHYGWATLGEIASEYGVSVSTISDIVHYEGAYAFVVV